MKLKHAAKAEQSVDNESVDRYVAIHLNPNDDIACGLRAQALLTKGNPQNAVLDCTEAIRLNPQNADMYWLRGKAHSQEGDVDKAKADQDKAIQLKPSLRLR
ncbi:MAG: hypothetical protein NTY19_06560 [Planctomycetota bacterium]|nr:hypothetical protein [Planctomycetota bacterium]